MSEALEVTLYKSAAQFLYNASLKTYYHAHFPSRHAKNKFRKTLNDLGRKIDIKPLPPERL